MKIPPITNLDQAPFAGLLMRQIDWADEITAELHLLGMNLHNLSVEVAEISDLDRRRPCLSKILEGYANRIDELMKRAPEVVS